MHISSIWMLAPVVLLLSVTQGAWEVLNEVSEVETDVLNLPDEYLIPAQVTVMEVSREDHRRLASDQNKQQNKSPQVNPKSEVPQPTSQNPAGAELLKHMKNFKDQKNIITVNKTISQNVSTNHARTVEQSSKGIESLEENDEDEVTSEGFLLLENRIGKTTPTSRNLAQYIEVFSPVNQQSSRQENTFGLQITGNEITSQRQSSIKVKIPEISKDVTKSLGKDQEDDITSQGFLLVKDQIGKHTRVNIKRAQTRELVSPESQQSNKQDTSNQNTQQKQSSSTTVSSEVKIPELSKDVSKSLETELSKDASKSLETDDEDQITSEGFLLVKSGNGKQTQAGRKRAQNKELFSQEKHQSNRQDNIFGPQVTGNESTPEKQSSIDVKIPEIFRDATKSLEKDDEDEITSEGFLLVRNKSGKQTPTSRKLAQNKDLISPESQQSNGQGMGNENTQHRQNNSTNVSSEVKITDLANNVTESPENYDEDEITNEGFLLVKHKTGKQIPTSKKLAQNIELLSRESQQSNVQDTIFGSEIKGNEITSQGQRSTTDASVDVQISDKSINVAQSVEIADEEEITNEGFLLVKNKSGKQTSTNRKLAQNKELFSPESQQSDTRGTSNEISPQRQRNSMDISTNVKLPEISKDVRQQKFTQQEQQLNKQQLLNENTGTEVLTPVLSEGAASLEMSLKLACIVEGSWECLMLREDVLPVRSDPNLTSRALAKERAKRQAVSGNVTNTNTGTGSPILGCEHGECFSGNGTDTDEEEVVPTFTSKSTTRTKTNLTDADLDDKTRHDIVKQLEDQLNDIFKDVTGFKNVSIDPAKIFITTDGILVVPWEITVDGGNPNFSGQNGEQVRNTVEGALQEASSPYKNVSVDGERPIDPFNSTEAADQIQQQANDPCKMKPSPCSKGYGSCERLPNRGNGIELKCVDNCRTYGTCQNNGACLKDMTGTAYCQCSTDWIGLYCNKLNDTTAPPDQLTAPLFKFTSPATFNTSLTPDDLTPELRAEIAKNITEQLLGTFQNLPGFINVTVDPNSITIKDGKLTVDWGVSLDSRAFNEESPKQIGNIIRDALRNVSGGYRHNIVIGDQTPLQDFDYVAAADQVEASASDPCNTDPCSKGYANCRASSPVVIICIHNCNTIAACQNGGTCQIKSSGEAFCQCPSGWSGDNCNVQKDQLDGGEITGIVLGSALLAVGVLGCMFWCLCIRKGNRDMIFTNYTDEEGSGSFSNASSKLWVIDRPNVSARPLPIFGPSFNASPPPSASSSSGSSSSNVSRRASMGKVRNSQA